MARLLENKIAAVTGGTTGIGRAIVLEFLRQGAKVAVNHLGRRSETDGAPDFWGETLDAARKDNNEDNIIDVVGDISRPETGKNLVEQAVRKWNRLDIFVSNAGVCQFEEFLDVTPDLLEGTISTNLTGSFYAIQAAARRMVEQGEGGSIIGISSISALVGGGGQTHYTPTKAGILSLMQSTAVALGKHGIRCNALLPGTIRTQLNDQDLSNQEKRKYMEGRIPLGRTGAPNDLAGPAVFLASSLSAYVTGAQILVDGGAFVNFQ